MLVDQSDFFEETPHDEHGILFTYHGAQFGKKQYEEAKKLYHRKGYGYGIFDIAGCLILQHASGGDRQFDIPIQEVRVDCLINGSNFRNLYSGPKKVLGCFDAHSNRLRSLEWGPEKTGGSYIVSNNDLTSLKHSPAFVGGDFNCMHNRITSFEGCPKVVKEGFFADGNNIHSLIGIHNHLKECKTLHLHPNIKEGGIGLLLIYGLTYVELPKLSNFIKEDPNRYPRFYRACEIINKYLRIGKSSVLLCQEELIEAGLDEFAIL